MQKPTAPPFSVEVSELDGALRAALRGDADAPGALGSELEEVHARAIASRAMEVVVDLRDLEFASTDALRKLAELVGLLERTGSPPAYRLRFLSSPSILWQRRGLRPLVALAPGAVTVEDAP